MDSIDVKKDKLRETLLENRDAHRSQFLKAQEKYREKVIEELDRRLEQARSGGRIDLGFMLPEPVDYTSQYDTVIKMVDWAQGDTIELSQSDFERYVLNKWEWARSFAASTQSYLAGGE